jgi:hypothetical protein
VPVEQAEASIESGPGSPGLRFRIRAGQLDAGLKVRIAGGGRSAVEQPNCLAERASVDRLLGSSVQPLRVQHAHIME